MLATDAGVLLWQQVQSHLRPTPTKPTGDSPMSSLVSNLELIATWSLPRPMICKSQAKGDVTILTDSQTPLFFFFLKIYLSISRM